MVVNGQRGTAPRRGVGGILTLARPGWAALGLAACLGAVGSLLGNILLALSLRYLVDAFYLRHLAALRTSWAVLGAAAILVPVLAGVNKYLFALAVQTVLKRVRTGVYAKVGVLPRSYLDAHESGGITSLLINDTGLVGEGLVSHASNLVSSAAGLIGATIILISWNPDVVVLVAVLGVAAFAASVLWTGSLAKTAAAEQDLLSQVMSGGTALASGLLVIKSLRCEESYYAKFGSTVGSHLGALRARGRAQAWLTATSAATGEAFYPVVHLGAGLTALAGKITPGTAGAIAQLASQTVAPTTQLAVDWAELHRAAASSDRILAFLNEEEGSEAHDASQELASGWDYGFAGAGLGCSVGFESVTFGYPGSSSPVLRAVTFGVGAGRRLAVVGESGCGKSTILRLLLGLYPVREGRVRIGAATVGDPSAAGFLRRAVTLCPQDLQLLPYSIWENLRIVATDEEEITRAAQTLGLSEVVASLPDGWETLVAKLSGGQRQLVAMTRAFLKPAPLLLLDEPTSHLDLYAERRACEGMRTLAIGRTVILTTHRVLNLDWVDDILVIAGDRVIESGSFGELLQSHGVFASFHERQSLEAPRLRKQSLHGH